MKKGLMRIRLLGLTPQQDFNVGSSQPLVRLNHNGQLADLTSSNDMIWYDYSSDTIELQVLNPKLQSTESGFAEIKLTEIMKYPDVFHKINVHASVRDRNKGFTDREAALVVLELLYNTKPFSGKLKLTIVSANLVRDTEFMGKMDPYVVVKHSKEFRTKVINQGGKTPRWDQTFELQVNSINEKIEFIVMDEDITKDDEVGRTQIILRDSGFMSQKEQERDLELWFREGDKGAIRAGTLKVRGLLTPI